MLTNANSFAKTICSICYEDLKPIVEDLQAISICGHVFHELCLQQWFEYCSNSKKCSCPVCKQNCSGSSVARLYFQSLGDHNESFVSQKVIEYDENPELLRGEVRRLEVKVSGLTSNLELQAKEITKLNEELHFCKDQLKKETILKNDVIGQKASVQQLLHSKSEELDSLKLECLRLKDRNMALAKELAALKLVSDLNLEEDEVLKLASFGNDANNRDTIDILKKSLVIRNKSYKELMAKCNQLGRGEARSCEELEKAKGKITKLKTRVQELEMIVEVKDNEALRNLKSSKKICKEFTINSANVNANAPSTSDFPSEVLKGKDAKSATKLDQNGSLNIEQGTFNIIKTGTSSATSFLASDKERNSFLMIDAAASELSTVHLLSVSNPKHPNGEEVKSTVAKLETTHKIDSRMKDYRGRNFDMENHKKGTVLAASDEEGTVIGNDLKHVKPILNIRKESPCSVPLTRPGDICFSSSLLGPDGTNRYLGKWCKRSQSKESVASRGTKASSGDLIAIGSDGRGGRVKVLRSLNQSSLQDSKENYAAAKRCKHADKPSNLQSQGCLQITLLQ